MGRLQVRTLLIGLALVLSGHAAVAADKVGGTVTNAGTGAPVSGANVFLLTGTGVPVSSASTAPDGTYQFTPGAGTYYVEAEGPLLRHVRFPNVACGGTSCPFGSGTLITIDATAGTVTADIALPAAARLAGRVTQANGVDPLAGVTVNAFGASFVFASATTNASGDYVLDHLPADDYLVSTVNTQGYIDEAFDNMICLGCFSGTPVPAAAGATATINFALEQGGRISGTVTRESDSTPIAGVTVTTLVPGTTTLLDGTLTRSERELHHARAADRRLQAGFLGGGGGLRAGTLRRRPVQWMRADGGHRGRGDGAGDDGDDQCQAGRRWNDQRHGDRASDDAADPGRHGRALQRRQSARDQHHNRREWHIFVRQPRGGHVLRRHERHGIPGRGLQQCPVPGILQRARARHAHRPRGRGHAQ